MCSYGRSFGIEQVERIYVVETKVMHIENLGFLFLFFFYEILVSNRKKKKKMVALRIERVGNGRKQWK